MTMGGGTLNVDTFSLNVGAVNGATGTITSNANGQLTLGNGGADGAYGGAITGPIAITKIGAGTQTLSGASSFNGGISINAGVVAAGGATSLGAATNNVNLTAGSGTSTLRLSGNSVSIGQLQDDGGFGIVENASANPATLSVAGAVGHLLRRAA